MSLQDRSLTAYNSSKFVFILQILDAEIPVICVHLSISVLERELFSESEEVSLQECNRIRDEAGFRPIPQPQHSREPGKSKKPAPSSRKSGHMTRKSHHTQESRVTYPSTDYY